jgi:hypothetical protein
MKLLGLTILLLLVVTSACGALAHWVLPRGLFRKAVLNPIPPSVKNIRASGFFLPEACHTYVLRFTVSEEDIRLILSSGPFKEIGYVQYQSGILTYGEHQFPRENYTRYRDDEVIGTYEHHSDVGLSFMLFEGWRGWFPPRWFQFAKWRTFKAYVVERKDPDLPSVEVHLLLHNAELGQTYFINYEVRGTW